MAMKRIAAMLLTSVLLLSCVGCAQDGLKEPGAEKADLGLTAYVGKPNPLMMRTGLNILGCHSQDTAIIGDRMDTDIVAGIECGLDTVLVLSGVTSREEIGHFPYRPRLVLKGVGEIPAAKGLPSAASACIIDKDPGQVPQGAPDSKGQPPCLKGAAK